MAAQWVLLVLLLAHLDDDHGEAISAEAEMLPDDADDTFFCALLKTTLKRSPVHRKANFIWISGKNRIHVIFS